MAAAPVGQPPSCTACSIAPPSATCSHPGTPSLPSPPPVAPSFLPPTHPSPTPVPTQEKGTFPEAPAPAGEVAARGCCGAGAALACPGKSANKQGCQRTAPRPWGGSKVRRKRHICSNSFQNGKKDCGFGRWEEERRESIILLFIAFCRRSRQ